MRIIINKRRFIGILLIWAISLLVIRITVDLDHWSPFMKLVLAFIIGGSLVTFLFLFGAIIYDDTNSDSP